MRGEEMIDNIAVQSVPDVGGFRPVFFSAGGDEIGWNVGTYATEVDARDVAARILGRNPMLGWADVVFTQIKLRVGRY